MRASWIGQSWGLLAAAFLLLSACGHGSSAARDYGEGDGGASGGATPKPELPLPECPETEYRPCDIREADCQKELAGLAACMRGSAPLDQLEIDVLSQDEYIALVKQDYANYVAPTVPHFWQALGELGFVPATRFALTHPFDVDAYAADQAKQILGVYRSSEKRVVIVDHGKAADSPDVDTVLVHELVHALQDVDYDLTKWEDDGAAPSFDHNLTQESVFEGEARFYEYRGGIPLFGYKASQVDPPGDLNRQMRNLAKSDFDDDSPYEHSRGTFPYGFGSMLSLRDWTEDGPAGIAKVWATPPTSTQAVMSAVLRVDEPQPAAVDLTPPAPTDLTLAGTDRLGAWGLTLLLTKQGLVWSDATTAALSWRGDQLWVYSDDTDRPTYALWEIELGDAAAAQTLNDAIAKVSDAAHNAFDFEMQGTRVFVTFSYGNAALPALSDAGKAWLDAK